MLKIPDTWTIYPTVEMAEKVATVLKANDEDWDYKVIPSPNGNGKAVIKVYDEDGIFLANFGG